MLLFACRLAAFLAITTTAYLALLLVLANAGESVKTWVRHNTNIPVGIPPRADTSARFREIPSVSDVDILFVGSSHCYRAFDPRIFAGESLRSFNMGSTAQSPLNSYFLLRQHLDRLRPRLVVFEAYWEMFENDGAESFLDLNAAIPINWDLAWMAWATKSILAWNGFLVRLMEMDLRSSAHPKAVSISGEQYIAGGFVERKAGTAAKYPHPDRRIVVINPTQLRYLRKMLRMAREAGANAYLVVQPIPKDTISSFVNRKEINMNLAALADTERAHFQDFNELLRLEGPDYFYDPDHLTQRGVREFDLSVLQQVKKLGLLKHRPPRL